MVEGKKILKTIRLGWLSDLFNKVYSLFRSSGITKEEALEIARRHHLETEVAETMKYGYSPEEALEEWDLI
jgi:hypothetical protein